MMKKPFHTTLQSYTVLMRCCGSYMHTLCNKSYLMTEETLAGSSVNSVCGYKRGFFWSDSLCTAACCTCMYPSYQALFILFCH